MSSRTWVLIAGTLGLTALLTARSTAEDVPPPDPALIPEPPARVAVSRGSGSASHIVVAAMRTGTVSPPQPIRISVSFGVIAPVIASKPSGVIRYMSST